MPYGSTDDPPPQHYGDVKIMQLNMLKLDPKFLGLSMAIKDIIFIFLNLRDKFSREKIKLATVEGTLTNEPSK